eukprot:4319395-Ditylum_brightwellii.AAC.1
MILSLLVAWNTAVAAESSGLRGGIVTQGEDPRSLVLLPPHTSLPEGAEDIFISRVGDEGNIQGELRQLGIEAKPRIVNGHKADDGSHPYFTLVLGKTELGGWLYNRGCGATLIEDEWILTAAHCNNKAGHVAWIGAYDAGSNETFLDLEECFQHPKYKWPQYDYALCRLNETSSLPKIKIAEAGYQLEQDEPLTVIGTGATSEDGWLVQMLNEVEVKYQTKDICLDTYRAFREDSMLCAGGEDKDACQGDSGGPLFFDDNGSHVQVGIVSWGSGCAREGYPGVYADVAMERDWIDQIICENS